MSEVEKEREWRSSCKEKKKKERENMRSFSVNDAAVQ